MATTRIPKGGNKTPAQLSLVDAQADTRTATQKRKDNIVKAQAARTAARKARAAARGDEPSNLEKYRAGNYPVQQWSPAEIRRGRPEGRDGFAGPAPTFTGKQQAEIKRELLKRGQARFDALYSTAIEVVADVAKNGEKDADRLKAAAMIKEMVAGKVPDRIEIKSSDPWQDILDDIMDDAVLERVQDARAEADR